MAQPFDLIILTNGPGEVTTWLRPVVQAVRAHWGSLPRISVVLAPCSHSTGQEAAIARSYPEVDRVQAAKHFSHFCSGEKPPNLGLGFPRGWCSSSVGINFSP